MVITGLTRNQFARKRTRVRIPFPPPNKTDADRASVPLFLWRDSNGSVVNDLPVAGQSRPRPSPQARATPRTGLSGFMPGCLCFLDRWRESNGSEVNDSPVGCQSRPCRGPQARATPRMGLSGFMPGCLCLVETRGVEPIIPPCISVLDLSPVEGEFAAAR